MQQQQPAGQMSLEEAKERAPHKIQWYQGLDRWGYYLPAYTARICTNDFLM